LKDFDSHLVQFVDFFIEYGMLVGNSGISDGDPTIVGVDMECHVMLRQMSIVSLDEAAHHIYLSLTSHLQNLAMSQYGHLKENSI
jgi:hypothetical protein